MSSAAEIAAGLTKWLSALVSWPVLISLAWVALLVEVHGLHKAIDRQSDFYLCVEAAKLSVENAACRRILQENNDAQ